MKMVAPIMVLMLLAVAAIIAPIRARPLSPITNHRLPAHNQFK
jgi:hypothetical protein